MRTMVTGGLGYIGSHTVVQLREAGIDVIIVDDGRSPSASPGSITNFCNDLRQPEPLVKVMKESRIDSIIHLAGSKNVGESVANPGDYIANNIQTTVSLVRAAIAAKVKTFVFSSSCSVYGDHVSRREIRPTSPYAATKVVAEELIRQFASLGFFNAICLRYFNAAGASTRWRLGERSSTSKNLIPKILTSVEDGVPMPVFMAPTATNDGTCIRDYIHVEDLADAHVRALTDCSREQGVSASVDLGTGVGTSTAEIVAEISRCLGFEVAIELHGPRLGDPSVVISSSNIPANLESLAGWNPVHARTEIISSAVRWWRHERQGSGQLPDLSRLKTWGSREG